MKRIGSLLTAGALALSLVTLPAGAAEAAPALEETAQAAAQAALTAGGAQSIQYALWQDGEIILTGHAGNYSRTENRALTDDILYGVGSGRYPVRPSGWQSGCRLRSRRGNSCWSGRPA